MDESRTREFLQFPDSEPGERWLPVVDWEDLYAVSDFGRVRGLDRTVPHGYSRNGVMRVRGRILKPALAGPRRNYRSVGLYRDDVETRRAVHLLVLKAFVGPCPVGCEALHGPAGSLVNTLANLSWGTRAKNLGPDKVRDGTINRGQRNGQAKLCAAQVVSMRQRAANGESLAALAVEFRISKAQVWRIVTGERWTWLPMAQTA